MKQVIICEKPSLAKAVISALSTQYAFDKQDGYSECDKYIVVSAFGHLFGLYNVEDYTNSEDKRWVLDNLPFVPETFKFKLKEGKDKKEADGIKKRFEIIASLVNRKDVSSIIHCGDADREGELIVRTIVENALTAFKPMFRLWLPEQTEKGILLAFDDLKSDKEYDNLAKEGFARTYMDWLYGINLTRYLTLITGTTMRVGRVLIPIVRAIYDRDKEIATFESKPFFQVQHKDKKDGIEYAITEEKRYDVDERANAIARVNELNGGMLTVLSVDEKETVARPKKLFFTSTLQSALNDKYKMPLKESTAVIQSLYENGYLTYPRTETEYLGENEVDRVEEIIGNLQCKGLNVVMKTGKAIFDDSKIVSHSAITPTYKIPNMDSLSEKEKLVYQTVLNRFCSVFCTEECVLFKTEVSIQASDVNRTIFKLTGTRVKRKGFLEFEPQNKEKELPHFTVGEKINPLFTLYEGKTEPPKHYTVKTLLAYLINPFKTEKAVLNSDGNEDDVDYKALLEGVEIGTEATRARIIENAKDNLYISETKGTYYIQDMGKALIATLDKLNINLYKEKSVELNKTLRAVNQNKKTVEDVVEETKRELKQLIKKDILNLETNLEEYKEKLHTEREVIGKCPKCGKPIFENPKAFSCSADKKDCGFALFKEDFFFYDKFKKKVTRSMARGLINNNETFVKGLVNKEGKSFDALIKVDWSKKYPKYEFDFSKNPKKSGSSSYGNGYKKGSYGKKKPTSSPWLHKGHK